MIQQLLRIGPKLTTASALESLLSSPKVNVKDTTYSWRRKWRRFSSSQLQWRFLHGCCLTGLSIGGFNQRQREALPPQIFLTLSRFVFTVQTRKIGSVYSQENYRNCCHLMSDFKAKNAPNSISAGALPQTPLWELTALPRPQLTPFPLSVLRASKQLASPNMYP